MPAEHGGDDASSLDKNIWSVAWLLEKMRAKQSSKWSGTNAHPTYTNNKLGNVLNAFAHFVYQYSQNTIVIADIQTSSLGPKNVLFDMMFHTETGDSGVGDHGQFGIETFVKAHTCVTRCAQLELDPLHIDTDSEKDD
ncbi:kinase-like protein [Dendrothele bispora CBS 962.96]|uniref:Kinase-like protein n=1 Tax=Dendrothele bispora (strain CBS 962.96) TaxID=1314807 RepID=A0A4S8KUH5_DENBC|nr:kinase-like protein [Dendrothele bispora CBS 962.96]THU79118.1 kinase-like protein [Dendrothele bispora CBS 962.96]